MSCKVVSGSEPQFHLCSKSYQPTKLSSHGCCSRLSFQTKFTKPSFCIKTASGSFRTMARASTINGRHCRQAQTMVTFYDLLGIPESGTLPEIKKAYKQLARKYHPDVSPPDRVEEHTRRFILVKEAYDTLSDPHSRAIYDRDLAGRFHLQRLDELNRRSTNRNIRGKASRGVRMRRHRYD